MNRPAVDIGYGGRIEGCDEPMRVCTSTAYGRAGMRVSDMS